MFNYYFYLVNNKVEVLDHILNEELYLWEENNFTNLHEYLHIFFQFD